VGSASFCHSKNLNGACDFACEGGVDEDRGALAKKTMAFTPPFGV
jgi:hypothetical protein